MSDNPHQLTDSKRFAGFDYLGMSGLFSIVMCAPFDAKMKEVEYYANLISSTMFRGTKGPKLNPGERWMFKYRTKAQLEEELIERRRRNPSGASRDKMAGRVHDNIIPCADDPERAHVVLQIAGSSL